MSERIPSGVLVARARATAEWHDETFKGLAQGTVDLLTALADRLAELAGLEALLRWVNGGSTLTLWGEVDDYCATLETDETDDEAHGDTPEAALAALAEQVRP